MKYSEMASFLSNLAFAGKDRVGQNWRKDWQGVGAKYWDQFLADATSGVMVS